MIEESVAERVQLFAEFWGDFYRESPALRMDFSWPSIGLVDLALRPIYGQEEFGMSERELIKGVSSYLCVIAHDCWELFAKKVQVVEHPVRGFGLSGTDENGDGFEVAVEERLREIYTNPPNPFPVIGDFSRFIAAENNILPLFSLGLCSGLSPFSEHGYGNKSPREFQERINKVVRHLAAGTARYYEEAFPDEPLGQVAELYLNSLIYPPMLMEEALPGCAAVHGMFQFFDSYGVQQPHMLKLAQNLARMPDETLASVGSVIWSALSDEPPKELVVLSETRGRIMVMLRTAQHQAKKRLGRPAEYIGVQEFGAIERRLFEAEYRLGLIPWIKLSTDRVAEHPKDRNILELLKCLVELDGRGAMTACDTILRDNPNDVEIAVQKIYLSIVHGKFQEAQEQLSNLMSVSGSESNAGVFGLWGILDIAFDFPNEAVNHLKAAIELSDNSHLDRGEFLTNYSWALWLNQQYQDALVHTDLAIQMSPSPLNALLNKAEMLWQLKHTEEGNEVLTQALELAPLHPRAFVHRLMAQEINS